VPAASHVQIVNVPYFLDTNGDSRDQSSRSKVAGFFGRRAARLRPSCNAETLHRQIEAYLDRAVTLRAERRHDLQDCVVWPARKTSGLWLTPKPQAPCPRQPVRSPILAKCG
jgi:hypothetical protein